MPCDAYMISDRPLSAAPMAFWLLKWQAGNPRGYGVADVARQADYFDSGVWFIVLVEKKTELSHNRPEAWWRHDI